MGFGCQGCQQERVVTPMVIEGHVLQSCRSQLTDQLLRHFGAPDSV